MAVAAIFSVREAAWILHRATNLRGVDCRDVPPRKDGGVEVSNETDGRLPNVYTPKAGPLKVSWTPVGMTQE